MSIALAHFFSLVPHPGVDESLVNATSGAIGGKGVPKNVPTAKFVPNAAMQGSAKMVVHLVAGCDAWILTLGLASRNEKFLAEYFHAAWMFGKPLLKHLRKTGRKWDVPSRSTTTAPFLFAYENLRADKIHIVDSATQYFTSACAGVCRETKHRIDKRLQISRTDMFENFGDLRNREEQ